MDLNGVVEVAIWVLAGIADSNSNTSRHVRRTAYTLRHAAVMQYGDNHTQQGLVMACCFLMLLLLPVFYLLPDKCLIMFTLLQLVLVHRTRLQQSAYIIAVLCFVLCLYCLLCGPRSDVERTQRVHITAKADHEINPERFYPMPARTS